MSSSLFSDILFWILHFVGILLNDHNKFCKSVQCTIDLCTIWWGIIKIVRNVPLKEKNIRPIQTHIIWHINENVNKTIAFGEALYGNPKFLTFLFYLFFFYKTCFSDFFQHLEFLLHSSDNYFLFTLALLHFIFSTLIIMYTFNVIVVCIYSWSDGQDEFTDSSGKKRRNITRSRYLRD